MLERIRKRTRSKSISISQDLWDKIEKVCDDNISISSFIRMAIKNELNRRNMGD